jgi:hypothetical protein
MIRAFLVSALLATLTTSAAEFPGAVQPQLAATAGGRVWVAFGHGPEIFVAASSDGGVTFDPPVRVAALPSLALGRRRGPRIVAHGNNVTVTAIAGDLFAFNSKDAGKTWTGPVLINDARTSAREGLDNLAVAPDGRLFAVWLDDRTGPKQLFGAESTDGGATWSANQLIYRRPEGTICECCHPSAQFNAHGELAVMWRNSIDGNRDLWFAKRASGAGGFTGHTKLGDDTWPLKGCPMDGGALFAVGENFGTIWQRAGAIYFARPGAPERKVADGTQPVALATPRRSVAVWQQGKDLWSVSLAEGSSPVLLARVAQFPSIAAIPGTDRILVAYERGTDAVVAALE